MSPYTRSSAFLMALAWVTTVDAAPNDPNHPQPAFSTYVVRELGTQADANEFSKISGTTVVWSDLGDINNPLQNNVFLYNPPQSNSTIYTLNQTNKAGFSRYGYDVFDQGAIWGEVDQGPPPAGNLFTSNGPASSQVAIPGVAGKIDIMPRVSGANRVWMRLHDYTSQSPYATYEASVNGAPVTIEAAGVFEVWDSVLSGDYLAYIKETAGKQELWGYQFSSQTHTLLTDPNYNWTLNAQLPGSSWQNIDLDGSRVVWNASYPDDGPLYDNYEIYSYDLAVGPSSYRQVTQNGTDDVSPRAAGGRLAWMGTGPLPSEPLIFEEKNGANVHVANGNLIGLSETTLAWNDFANDQKVHAKVLGKEYHVKQGNELFYNLTSKGVSGANFTFTSSDPNEPWGTNSEVWVAYYVGPGAVLTGVDLTNEELAELKLTWADMRLVDLTGADLTRTDFRGSDLTGATGLEYTSGAAIFSHQTILPEYFNAHDAGWSYVTPEPSTLLLAVLGLFALGNCRHRHTTHGYA